MNGDPIEREFDPNPLYPIREGPSLRTNGAMLTSWVGVSLAGGLYPVVVFIAGLLGSLLTSGFRGLIPTAEMMLFTMMFLIIASGVGMLVAGIATLFSIYFVVIFNWTMGNFLKTRTAVSLVGGLAGFIATSPLAYGLAFEAWNGGIGGGIRMSIPAWLLIPLAMVMGHMGGVWVVHRDTSWKLIVSQEETRQRPQFQIRHMFALTAWFAVAFGAARGLGGPVFLLCLSIAFGCQVMILVGDYFWMQRYLSSPPNVVTTPSNQSRH